MASICCKNILDTNIIKKSFSLIKYKYPFTLQLEAKNFVTKSSMLSITMCKSKFYEMDFKTRQEAEQMEKTFQTNKKYISCCGAVDNNVNMCRET